MKIPMSTILFGLILPEQNLYYSTPLSVVFEDVTNLPQGCAKPRLTLSSSLTGAKPWIGSRSLAYFSAGWSIPPLLSSFFRNTLLGSLLIFVGVITRETCAGVAMLLNLLRFEIGLRA